MRIAISTLGDRALKSGAGRYIHETLKALQGTDRLNQYHIYVGSDAGESYGDIVEGRFQKSQIGFSSKSSIVNKLWHTFILPLRLLIDGTDLLHLPWTTIYLFKVCPTVITILDVGEYSLPERYSRPIVIYRKAVLPIIVRLADRIITISGHSKQEIVRYLGVEPGKIEVIYCGVNKRFCLRDHSASVARIEAVYGNISPYILYVGQISHPGKNLVRLIEAYSKLRKKGLTAHKLVLAGVKSLRAEAVFHKIQDEGLETDVIYLGYVPDRYLPTLYSASELFVYPSLFEGFGVAMVEAMASGIPVVASNTSALPEILGGAGILFDPLDVGEMAEAMRIAISDTRVRRELIAKGLTRASGFSWEEAAQRTLRVYERAYSDKAKEVDC